MLTLFPRFFRLIQVHLYNLQCSPRTHIRTWKISIDWSKGLSANGAEGKWGKQKLNCVNCNSLNQLIYSQTFENVGDYSSNMLVFFFQMNFHSDLWHSSSGWCIVVAMCVFFKWIRNSIDQFVVCLCDSMPLWRFMLHFMRSPAS